MRLSNREKEVIHTAALFSVNKLRGFPISRMWVAGLNENMDASYPKVIAVAATTGSPFRPRARRLSAEHRVQSRQQ